MIKYILPGLTAIAFKFKLIFLIWLESGVAVFARFFVRKAIIHHCATLCHHYATNFCTSNSMIYLDSTKQFFKFCSGFIYGPFTSSVIFCSYKLQANYKVASFLFTEMAYTLLVLYSPYKAVWRYCTEIACTK